MSVFLLLGGCDRIAQYSYLSGYERDIENASRAIENAPDDAHRAAGYADRGSATSEKARYSRSFKLIPAGEYVRLFDLAIKDHDRAVALDPGSVKVYFSRGQTYYSRAALELQDGDAKPWFDLASADFEKATERDSRDYMAFDFLGLVHLQSGDMDKAIADFTREMALNPLGKTRLADAHCERGSVNYKAKQYDAAIADFERSIELGANDDGCSCEPYSPLISLYDGPVRKYDKAWEVVHKARKSGKWIAPEVIERLKKHSGRNE